MVFLLAVKSNSLQEKIKALNNAGLSVSTQKLKPPSTSNMDEPLKIIENNYCNTK